MSSTAGGKTIILLSFSTYISIITYHQAKAGKQCRPPGANILLLGECILEGVLTEWLGPGGLGPGSGLGNSLGGGICTPPPQSVSSTSSAFSILQDNPQWAKSRVLLMRTSAGYVLEVYTPPEVSIHFNLVVVVFYFPK